MDFSFEELKYLVDVIARDLLQDDFGNLQDSQFFDAKNALMTGVSNEIYDKVVLLAKLLVELAKHRPVSL